VIVTTDNGTAPKLVGRIQGRSHRGGVGTNLEQGINVPLIVNWPKCVPGGRVVHELVDYSEFLPTLAELAGAELPAGVTLDGRSFAGLLRGGGRSPRRDWVFSQYYRTRMVGDGRFKLYSTGELFNVSRDVDEKEDLSGRNDAQAVAARRRLQAVLGSLPKDAELPFSPRSQSAFAIQARERQSAPAGKSPR
jgi:arylsulfatase A